MQADADLHFSSQCASQRRLFKATKPIHAGAKPLARRGARNNDIAAAV
jgi:hypothetical protein